MVTCGVGHCRTIERVPLEQVPVETVSATAAPLATEAPAPGDWLITLPEATAALHCCVTAEVRPSAISVEVAADWV
jgi:hypothetical protein